MQNTLSGAFTIKDYETKSLANSHSTASVIKRTKHEFLSRFPYAFCCYLCNSCG